MIVLRDAMAEDATQTGAILGEFATGTSWMPVLHSGAENESHCSQMIENGWVTVAEEGGVLLGFISRDETYIHALFVAEAVRNSGVGSQLLDHAKTKSQHLNLWTFQANRGAQRFYLRHGFHEIDRTNGSENDEGLPDVRFQWLREN